ncbi:MAG: hypothetical protein ACKV19_15710 [Verrucomicrobiales bacterium]
MAEKIKISSKALKAILENEDTPPEEFRRYYEPVLHSPFSFGWKLRDDVEVTFEAGELDDAAFGNQVNAQANNFTPGGDPLRFLNAAFNSALVEVVNRYWAIAAKVAGARPAAQIFVHCYDFVRPHSGGDGKWLGGPLEAHGITQQEEKDAVIGVVIGRFRDGLREVAANSGGKFMLVDTAGTVPAGQWHDEIHANDTGYAPVAARWHAALAAAGLA